MSKSKEVNLTKLSLFKADAYDVLKFEIENDMLVFISDGYFGFEEWKKIPKVSMFFLITSDKKINLPSKKSYQFLLKNK